MINVWANCIDTPGRVCEDARLSSPSPRWPGQDRNVTSTDQLYGQAGWDRGIIFRDIGDLATKIEKFQLFEIKRLAIHAHGGPGAVFINGSYNQDSQLTARSVANNHQSFLRRIGMRTPEIGPRTRGTGGKKAVILFVGCKAAVGESGTQLLLALSRLWQNRMVVAFGSLGYVAGGETRRRGEQCSEPGMRDTGKMNPGEAEDDIGMWSDLKKWPWASESSPSAKVALNDRIILGANL